MDGAPTPLKKKHPAAPPRTEILFNSLHHHHHPTPYKDKGWGWRGAVRGIEPRCATTFTQGVAPGWSGATTNFFSLRDFSSRRISIFKSPDSRHPAINFLIRFFSAGSLASTSSTSANT